VQRAARKEVARLEREIDKLTAREADLHHRMALHATDHERLRELTHELADVRSRREAAEASWIEAAEALDG
jgi:ATP-binding cassette subfamily F protein uup